jgi:hypothetical protein
VKGHQDDRKAYKDLDNTAQQNIDVDHLATSYVQSGQKRPMRSIQRVDEQSISLTINGLRYPGNLEANLRWHINGSYLKQYLQNRKGWNEEVWNNMDLHNFGSHFKTLSTAHQVHQSKFIYDLLSLGTQKAKISPIQPNSLHLCPCCCTHTENSFHLLHCTQNPGHLEAVTGLKAAKSLRSKENHFSIPLLYHGIIAWMHNPTQVPSPIPIPIATLNRPPLPQHIIDLIRKAEAEQKQIGWHNAARGFLSDKWEMLASMHPTSNLPLQAQDGRRRIINLIQDTFVLTHTIWKARNQVLHDKSQKELHQTHHLEVTEITALQSHPGQLPFGDRHHCTNTTLQRLLSSSAATRRRWLMRVRRARLRHTSTDGKRQTQMTAFFTRSKPSHPNENNPIPFTLPPLASNQSNQPLPHNTAQQRMADINPGRPPDKNPNKANMTQN